MKYNFCTLFDSNYLLKGIGLYQSLINVCDDFMLYVVAFDYKCYEKLNDGKFAKMKVISLDEFEDNDLLSVKDSRNKAEYCWTSGPSMIYYCIKNYSLDHCTYLDADLCFFSSPEIIFKEIGNNSIALTEHFTPKIDIIKGQFCVQFVYFKNDQFGMEALNWWKVQCINWCFARYEDGKYGDQKYLDSFPTLFKNVYVIKNRGVGVASWNFNQYNFEKPHYISYLNKEFMIVFYHFHGIHMEVISNKLLLRTMTFDITKQIHKNVFLPYLENIKQALNTYYRMNISSVLVIKRNIIEMLYSYIKKRLKHLPFAPDFYFKIMRVRYNGYKSKRKSEF